MSDGGRAAQVVATSFVLAVPDLERSATYWSEVLGFPVVASFPGWRFVARGACRLMLGECRDAIPPGELGDHSYFGYVELDDLDAYHAEIAARGALILTAPADKPWGDARDGGSHRRRSPRDVRAGAAEVSARKVAGGSSGHRRLPAESSLRAGALRRCARRSQRRQVRADMRVRAIQIY